MLSDANMSEWLPASHRVCRAKWSVNHVYIPGQASGLVLTHCCWITRSNQLSGVLGVSHNLKLKYDRIFYVVGFASTVVIKVSGGIMSHRMSSDHRLMLGY